MDLVLTKTTYKMKEQDLREKFEDCVIINHVGIDVDQCVQIAIDYAREEAIGFGVWFHKNYQNIGIQLYRKFGKWENVTIEEAYEIYLTTKTK